jgi:hypothetical protein
VTLKQATSDTRLDSDINNVGYTDNIEIDTSFGIDNISRNNLTIDAGFKDIPIICNNLSCIVIVVKKTKSAKK